MKCHKTINFITDKLGIVSVTLDASSTQELRMDVRYDLVIQENDECRLYKSGPNTWIKAAIMGLPRKPAISTEDIRSHASHTHAHTRHTIFTNTVM